MRALQNEGERLDCAVFGFAAAWPIPMQKLLQL